MDSYLHTYSGSSAMITVLLFWSALTRPEALLVVLFSRFDIGPIVLQSEVAVPEEITSFGLSEILADHGAQLVSR